MRSKRHNASLDDAALDALRDCVMAVGVRRTTLTDVARRAGVSRMTLYRRWPDVRALVGELMTREWIAVARGAVPVRDGALTAREQLVSGLTEGSRALRAHPLFRKILDVDPELLLPYLLDRRGATQDVLLDLIAEDLRKGHADGSVRPDHAVRQARTLMLVAQSFTFSMRTMADEGDRDLTVAAFEYEMRDVLERMLMP